MTAVQYDGPITIAVGQSRRSTQWQNRDLMWSQLVNRLEIPERTQESAKEYKALPKAQRDEIKDVGGFVGGVLKGGRRKADAITQRRLLTLDLDEVPADADPWDTVILVLGCAAVLYSTHSHRPDAPRLRLVMALVHGLDTEAHIGSRPALERVTVEKLFIKEKINQTESLRQVLENGAFNDSALIDFVYDDWGRLAEGVRCRTEVAKMEVLSTGKMTIKENGLNFSVDFGVPNGNTGFDIDVSTPDKNVLAQIEEIVETARDKGFTVTGMVLSGAVLSKMRTNEGVSKAIYGGAGAGAVVSHAQLVGLFNELFGITEIRTNDLRYNVEGKDGKLTTQRFWGQSKVSFLASYNGLQNFGVGLWGVTPEEEQLGPWTAKSAEQFVTLTQWTEPDPTAVWSKASGLFVPVLPNPAGLFIATAKLQ